VQKDLAGNSSAKADFTRTTNTAQDDLMQPGSAITSIIVTAVSYSIEVKTMYANNGDSCLGNFSFSTWVHALWNQP